MRCRGTCPPNLQTILANCLAHGRRQFVDVAERFPEECRHVLESLSVIYHNDAIARERNLSPEERLLFHQAESGPTMEELHAWLARQFDERRVEPNSALGGAIAYLLKHWEKLTLFLRVAGAPLDNNICERALKKAILHRKNALLLQDLPRRPRRGRLHEPDPHLRTLRGQSLRLSDRAGTSRRRRRPRPPGLDALELPRNARPHLRPYPLTLRLDMPKRRPKKIVKTADVAPRLRKALAKRTKSELIGVLVELAEDDRNVLRRLDARFELEAPPKELVAATRQAIADATDFDERDINRNFDYDYAAYDQVKRNLTRLVDLGQLRLAMELSLELMDQGSHQVEMSDEGMMTSDIEECLAVVMKALTESDLPAAEKLAWCLEMTQRDRVGCIYDRELQAIRKQFERPQL